MKNREFSNTDAELSRCIKSRMREELQRFPLNDPKSLEIVREFLSELTQEIIQEGF